MFSRVLPGLSFISASPYDVYATAMHYSNNLILEYMSKVLPSVVFRRVWCEISLKVTSPTSGKFCLKSGTKVSLSVTEQRRAASAHPSPHPQSYSSQFRVKIISHAASSLPPPPQSYSSQFRVKISLMHHSIHHLVHVYSPFGVYIVLAQHTPPPTLSCALILAVWGKVVPRARSYCPLCYGGARRKDRKIINIAVSASVRNDVCGPIEFFN